MRVLRGFQRSRKKPRSGRGFHSVRAKLMFCALIRGLQNLDSPFGKGFNFVSGKLSFGCAESRFVEPRISLRGSTILFFSLVRKERGVPQRFANLWTPGTIQISARYIVFAEVTGQHHVTGRVENHKVSGFRR